MSWRDLGPLREDKQEPGLVPSGRRVTCWGALSMGAEKGELICGEEVEASLPSLAAFPRCQGSM